MNACRKATNSSRNMTITAAAPLMTEIVPMPSRPMPP